VLIGPSYLACVFVPLVPLCSHHTLAGRGANVNRDNRHRLTGVSVKKLWSIIFLSLTFVWATNTFAAEELAETSAIAQAVRQAMSAGDFQKLEELSSTYRKEKSRTSSGLWKLTLFYAGLNGVMYPPDANATGFFAQLERRTSEWAAAYPSSPAAHIAHSMVLVSRAWHARGSGYASSVRPEAWETFHRYIQSAQDNLERHKAVASVDARWYEEMLTVARAEGWDRLQFESLLNEALDREPYFYQTYFMALEYLLPKWHGDLVCRPANSLTKSL
jgi:hypothetical protein